MLPPAWPSLRPTGSLLRANTALCRILGYSEEELLDKKWLDLTHPGDLDSSVRFRSQFEQGLICHAEFEKRYIHKTGRAIPVRLRIAMVGNASGRPFRFILHVEDITESRRATEALRASEERYRLLFERNLAGVIRTTAAGWSSMQTRPRRLFSAAVRRRSSSAEAFSIFTIP